MTSLLNMVTVWYFIVFLGFVRPECPTEWLHFEQSCYGFIQAGFDGLDWNAAQSSCLAQHAMLAEPQTKTEAEYLIAIAKNITNGTDESYWLGGRDSNLDGTIVWSSSGRSLAYTAWGPGQPNNPGVQNCLEMSSNIKWKWNDSVCVRGKSYVCEKKYQHTGEIIG